LDYVDPQEDGLPILEFAPISHESEQREITNPSLGVPATPRVEEVVEIIIPELARRSDREEEIAEPLDNTVGEIIMAGPPSVEETGEEMAEPQDNIIPEPPLVEETQEEISDPQDNSLGEEEIAQPQDNTIGDNTEPLSVEEIPAQPEPSNSVEVCLEIGPQPEPTTQQEPNNLDEDFQLTKKRLGLAAKIACLPPNVGQYPNFAEDVSCQLSCRRCNLMCGSLGDISRLLAWGVVNATEPAAIILSESHAINSGILIRLHAVHPISFYYAGFSLSELPAFAELCVNLRDLYATRKALPNHCWSTFTHFEDLGLVAAVVFQTDKKVISCCTWSYKGDANVSQAPKLKAFIRECLGQILEKHHPPKVTFSGDTNGWRCNIREDRAPSLSAAYVQCSDCIVTCSTSIVRWQWRTKGVTQPCYAELYFEISYTLLAQMVMVVGQKEYSVSVTEHSPEMRDCVSHGKTRHECEQIMLQRVFCGKMAYKNMDPLDRGQTNCFLCQHEILSTESRLFYSCLCDTTIKSKGGVHASCLLSYLLRDDTFPASLRLLKTVDVGADMKCNNCKDSLTGNLLCMLPYQLGMDLHFEILLQPMMNYINPIGREGTKKDRKPFVWQRYHNTRELLLRTLVFCPEEKENLFLSDSWIMRHPQPLDSVDSPVPESDDESQSSDLTFPVPDDDDDDDSDEVSVDSSIEAVDAGFPVTTTNHDEAARRTLTTMNAGANAVEKRGLQIAFSSCVKTTRFNCKVDLHIPPISYN
jgi:hypothetical protein